MTCDDLDVDDGIADGIMDAADGLATAPKSVILAFIVLVLVGVGLYYLYDWGTDCSQTHCDSGQAQLIEYRCQCVTNPK